MKRTCLIKFLSAVMALALMFGICSTTISAAVQGIDLDNDEPSKKPTINYVSIGDSMTNGYGLDGYDGESGVANYANGTYANQFAELLAG